MTKFIHLALATYEHRIATDDKEAMVAVYKGHMHSDEMRSLNIGDHGDVPARMHGRRRVAGVKRKR